MKKKAAKHAGPKTDDFTRIAGYLFEVGLLRQTPRAHAAPLLSGVDLTDNIASHSFRAAHVAWWLASFEGADPCKTAMMCLLHDMPEARSNDHNWISKRYVKVFDDEIIADQFGSLPATGTPLHGLILEYQKRESVEAKIAKDADLIDQILLLKEYEHRGNKEAEHWLDSENESARRWQREAYFSESAHKLALAIRD